MCLTTGMDALEKTQISCAFLESNHNFWVFETLSGHYTEFMTYRKTQNPSHHMRRPVSICIRHAGMLFDTYSEYYTQIFHALYFNSAESTDALSLAIFCFSQPASICGPLLVRLTPSHYASLQREAGVASSMGSKK